MTSSSGYLLHCLLSLPLTVGAGALVGGASLAIGTAISGAVFLSNLMVSERLVRAHVEKLARGEDSKVFRPAARQLTTLPLALLLLVSLGAAPVALGLATVVVGLFLHLLVQAIHEAGTPVTTLAHALESRC